MYPSIPSHLQDADDKPEETDSRTENFDDENPHKKGGIGSVGEGRGTADDAHRKAAEEVGEAHREAAAEHEVAGVEVLLEIGEHGGGCGGRVLLRNGTIN